MHMNIATLKPSESAPTHPQLALAHMGRTLTQSPRYENGISSRYPYNGLFKKIRKFFGEIEWSGQQVHPPQQVLEARVVAEGVICGMCLDLRTSLVLLVGFLQLFKRSVLLT